MSARERPWDIVLFGATGFTGQLVAEELARQGRGRIRWALAGRREARLRAVKSTLVGMDPAHGEVGLIEADAEDSASLRRMAASARVVVSAVGPFLRLGSAPLAACVEERSHYLDLSGEAAFLRASRAAHAEAAREARIRVIHGCGFDSIPADLGAWFVASRLPGDGPRQVRAYLRVRGSISGGTWATFLEVAARGGPGADVTRRGPWLHRAPDGSTAVPWPVVDVEVVRESARCLPEIYGREFEFQEFLVTRTRSRALRWSLGLGAVRAAAASPALRRWLAARRPAGTGPDQETRERSSFDLTVVGRAGGRAVRARLSGGDPGYAETSRMLAASALLVATREADLPRAAGVLTPMVGLGPPLQSALEALGLRFEVVA